MTDTKRIRADIAEYEKLLAEHGTRTAMYVGRKLVAELPALLDNLDRAAGIIELQQKSRPLPMADCAGCESLKAEVGRLRSSNEMLEATAAKGCLALMDAKSGPRWIPVSEGLPDDDECPVIVTDGKVVRNAEFVTPYRTGYSIDGVFGCVNLTHWMPLPAAPEGD